MLPRLNILCEYQLDNQLGDCQQPGDVRRRDPEIPTNITFAA